MRVFVTVGTTKFDALVQTLDTDASFEALAARGCTHLQLQIGHGEHVPVASRAAALGIDVTHYRHSAKYKEDMARADLVISHAGAGSIMDALALRKELVVVVNTALMDNHQTELADAMAQQRYCVATTCAELVHTLRTADLGALQQYPEPDEDAFPRLVDHVMVAADRPVANVDSKKHA